MINEIKNQIDKLKGMYKHKLYESIKEGNYKQADILKAQIDTCNNIRKLIDEVIEVEVENIFVEEAIKWQKSIGTMKN